MENGIHIWNVAVYKNDIILVVSTKLKMSVILSFFLGFRLSSYVNKQNESSNKSNKNKSPNNSLRNKINLFALTSFTMQNVGFVSIPYTSNKPPPITNQPTSQSINNSNQPSNNDLNGKNILLTGFRDKEITNFIERSGGTVKSSISGTTNLLIVKDSSTSNKKTQVAEQKGIKIITKQEFIDAYMN